MQRLIDRIANMQTKETMVLAYGSGVRAISTLNPKHIRPCINMSLRRRLSKHFVVVDTPEHYTSKTCSRCHQACGPFETLQQQRRQDLLAKAKTLDEQKKARHHEIRGLRRCQNAECGVILNRDQNAAVNIATNFCRRYYDQPWLRDPSPQQCMLATTLQKLET